MPLATTPAGLVCPVCHRAHHPSLTLVRCSCGHLLDVAVALSSTTGIDWRGLFDDRLGSRDPLDISGVWRYRELVMSLEGDPPVSYPEGNTPLIESSALSHWTAVDSLQLKHEGMNPTGSFKDRGMTVGVTQARRLGAKRVGCASTGNTAASLAAYAALAGLPAVVLMPAGGVAPGKLAQALAYGAKTIAVRGDFDRCMALVEAASEDLGFYLLNSINPYRIAGQQAIILELLQQRRWDPPDWIVLPAGNLGNTSAFGRALVTAHQLGIIPRVPRLAAVQAAGASPFAQSFERDFASLEPVHADTVASAIRIGNPASWERAVRAVRATNGVVTTVSDATILEAKEAVDMAGIGCEAASAAAVAGVRRLRHDGVISRREKVVAVLTGHLLKDPTAGMGEPTDVITIDSTVEALRGVLEHPDA